jgi:hypothetical protein
MISINIHGIFPSIDRKKNTEQQGNAENEYMVIY